MDTIRQVFCSFFGIKYSVIASRNHEQTSAVIFFFYNKLRKKLQPYFFKLFKLLLNDMKIEAVCYTEMQNIDYSQKWHYKFYVLLGWALVTLCQCYVSERLKAV